MSSRRGSAVPQAAPWYFTAVGIAPSGRKGCVCMSNENIFTCVLRMFFLFLKRVWGYLHSLLATEDDLTFRVRLSLDGKSNCPRLRQEI